MRVLLVNPNQYGYPPVPPVGLEYVAGELQDAGFETFIVDLFFSGDVLRDLDEALDSFRPDVAGVTVRNVDTVLYQSNEFFLDGIREVVRHIRTVRGLPVIIGGAGISADPEGLLEYLGADLAVAGPGEGVVIEALGRLSEGRTGNRVIRRKYSYAISGSRKPQGTAYERYRELGGIAGFETHKGCGSSCIYCLEAGTPVSVRSMPDVVGEIGQLVDMGCDRFHLCDPEFNEDLDFAIDFLRTLRSSGPAIDWTLYMKPANHSRRLMQLMRETGVSLITLTVDSWKKCPLYWADIEKIIFSARSNGIRTAVDFLTGFPYEDEDTVRFYLDLFRRLQPDSVGINTYIRLYKGLKVTEIIARDSSLEKGIIAGSEDRSMIRPVFYNQLPVERLQELLGGDPLFRIEGLDKSVNYCRQGRPTAKN